MAKNIYVGNLVWEATADDLLELFQQYGSVARAQVITDRETGRSRGFGFVEMAEGLPSFTRSSMTAKEIFSPNTSQPGFGNVVDDDDEHAHGSPLQARSTWWNWLAADCSLDVLEDFIPLRGGRPGVV